VENTDQSLPYILLIPKWTSVDLLEFGSLKFKRMVHIAQNEAKQKHTTSKVNLHIFLDKGHNYL